ncbi:hypothetical protein EWM64_g2602 [Hericium alpestre]|uniref:Uncharacterized protein n=1 Tax=Hericium alpestre TaxID=135208 RepID=A0A4Z0A584_9AGAM|nr:hypothetical protein EWM64_g2602 [Hericium alpestre]
MDISKMCMQLCSGCQYTIPLAANTFKINLCYEELMEKALKVDDFLGELNEKIAALATQEDAGASGCSSHTSMGGDSLTLDEWSPVSLSPLSTVPGTPSVPLTPVLGTSPLSTPPSSPPLHLSSGKGLSGDEGLSDMLELEDDDNSDDDSDVDISIDTVRPPNAECLAGLGPDAHPTSAHADTPGKKRKHSCTKKPHKQNEGCKEGRKCRHREARAAE